MILFWVAALAITMLLYVLLDGFDLGVGILFLFTRDETLRRQMLSAISPVWDGNETWLILMAMILFGAFPIVYSALLSAFYLPMTALLASLILRGVAFEFRYKAVKMRWLWDFSFASGSLAATFIQGMTVGALVEGVPMQAGTYTGGPLGWFNPFSCFCGVGLCFGYALLGATWLAGKTQGQLRDRAYRHIGVVLSGVFVFLIVIFIWSLQVHLPMMQRWTERPYLGVFPATGAIAALRLLTALRSRKDNLLFGMSALILFSAFGTLAVSFWPFMVPFAITINQAAAPPASLTFMFWGAGIFVLPLTLFYTAVVYRIFSGKLVGEGSEE
jgi:cytochrome bd ubiquinol oxidase subunit II